MFDAANINKIINMTMMSPHLLHNNGIYLSSYDKNAIYHRLRFAK